MSLMPLSSTRILNVAAIIDLTHDEVCGVGVFQLLYASGHDSEVSESDDPVAYANLKDWAQGHYERAAAQRSGIKLVKK